VQDRSSNVIKIGSRVFQDDLSYVEIEEHGIRASGTRQRGCTKRDSTESKSKRRSEVMTVLDKSVWPQTRSNVMALSKPFKGTHGQG
ncbi:unnamed protein product, partial [Brassica rapa]